MSKSRGERSGKTPSGSQAASNNTQNAVVPGKLMETDWNELIEGEADDDFVDDIVHEIVDAACNTIFENVIQSRLKPYAVFSAKNLLLDLIKWRFLEYDKRELSTNTDPAWLEDEEPLACITDSWAQGAVPVHQRSISRTSREEVNSVTEKEELVNNSDTEERTAENAKEEEEEELSEGMGRDEECIIVNERDIDGNHNTNDEVKDTEEDLIRESAVKEESIAVSPHPSNKVDVTIHTKNKDTKSSKNRKQYKQYRGSLPNFPRISLTPITENRPNASPVKEKPSRSIKLGLISSDSFTTNRYGRPIASKEVIYDDAGNIVHVQRFNVAKLPNHRIPTKYSIIGKDDENAKKLKLLSRENKGIKTQKYLKLQDEHIQKSMVSSAPLLQRLYDSGGVKLEEDWANMLYTPLPPSLIDTVEIANGVTVREGGLSRQGPRKKNVINPSESHLLLPLGSATTRILDAKEIVVQSPATAKTFSDQKPLPSIKS